MVNPIPVRVEKIRTVSQVSAIAFGRIHILEEDSRKRAAIEKLAQKYAPNDTAENRSRVIDSEWGPLCLLEMTVEHLSGKEAIELVRGGNA